MDAARTSLRLGADKVYCVYRRSRSDMTALEDEIEGAISEGVEIMTYMAPSKIESDNDDNVTALWIKQQIPKEFDTSGRPSPTDADLPQIRLDADIIVMAIGQKVETGVFENESFPTERGNMKTLPTGEVFQNGKVFAGGDCATGPAAAIGAIAAGKVAAANIDEYLGYNHSISTDVQIPNVKVRTRRPRGRINTTLREASDRKNDFEHIECPMTKEGVEAESSSCLRCDKFGFGALRGGRSTKW